MKVIILFFLACLPLCVFSQYSITGSLISKEQPVNNCAVKLLSQGKVVRTTASNERGAFSFENLSAGQYQLSVVSIFYESFQQDIMVDKNVVLGNVLITEKVEDLKEITVTARKNPIVSTETGSLIEVTGTRLANRNFVTDILNYAPSISTSNGLEIYGNDNILIMLDGKELHIDKDKIVSFLDKIPVKSIKSIEVVDKVDASIDSSKAGIIKITTIVKDGWVGSLSHNFQYKRKLGYNDDLSLFYTKDKYRLFADLYNEWHHTFSDTEEQSLLRNNNTLYQNTSELQLKRKARGITLGADYYFNKKSTLSFLYIYDYDADADKEYNSLTNVYNNNVLNHHFTVNRKWDAISKDHSFSLNFDRTTDSLGSNIKIALDFVKKKYEEPLTEKDVYYRTITTEKNTEQNSYSYSDIYAFKTTWNKFFSSKYPSERKSLVVGLRYSLVDNQDEFAYFDILPTQRLKNTNFSNDFYFKEHILSTFANYTFPLTEKSKFSVGLRSEYNYNAFSNHSDNFHNDNTQWSLNALYTTKLSKETLYFSVRRWFDRVNYSLFNPTYIKNSPTEAYTGNKDLSPIEGYTLQSGYRWKKVDMAVAYRYSEKNVLNIPTAIAGVITTRPENVGYKNVVYLFLSRFTKFNDWWESNTKLTGGYFNFRYLGNTFNSLYAEFYTSQRFYLPKDIECSFSYQYISTNRSLYTKNYYNHHLNFDLMIPLSDSFKLKAFVIDVFNTSRYKSEYDFNSIYNTSYSTSNSRQFIIGISYDFAKGKEVNENVRDTGVEEEKNRLRK